jgi:indolepyruvate ferredoxin oxidoreductase beta subunit
VSELKNPICILIAALGGEGGGVLTDWIAAAARHAGLRVQCTSIPGVAQRTGATTYYIEIVGPGNRAALALTPMPGNVDVVVASELIEAARAVQNGYVSPDRTTLVASTHRVFATSEKSAMGDGRFDETRALKAATTLARRAVLFDMEAIGQQSRSAISAVMLGGVAGSGALPIERAVFEKVIQNSRIAVKTNLAGFDLAYRQASAGREQAAAQQPKRPAVLGKNAGEIIAAAKAAFPIESHYFIEQGIARLVDYQNEAYAQTFIERLQPVLELERTIGGEAKGFKLLCETARHLALRMSFEDLIRVADLKSRRTRFDRVRKEAEAKEDEPIVITEFFKPGLEEVCGFLPPVIAHRILGWAERTNRLNRFNVGIYLRTTSITGFGLLWATSRLRVVRRFGHRYAMEQTNIELWLNAVRDSAKVSYAFGLETAATARLIKGYSGTYRNGLANFNRILHDIVRPAINHRVDVSEAVREAVASALTHSGPEIATPPSGFKPLSFIRKGRDAGKGTERDTGPARPTAPL